MIFGYLILFISVMISVIAAYYSVAGLTAIFSAAVVPVIIMGGALEAGKIVSTVWLHNNWKRAGVAFKLYLIPAIVFLMLLTSMGIFGFLSKAHSDQSLVTGDAGSKVAIYDEKIQTAKGNIDADRKALKQMDEAVDQVMGRSSDEKGADKAVAIRRGQQKERARLLAEIAAEQKTISTLSEERAPFAADLRKVESEVGPIKYIAALVYGDEASKNMLEAAVRWVIILIVIVFDPLALTLILAANKQLEWARKGKGGWVHDEDGTIIDVAPDNKILEEKAAEPAKPTPLDEEEQDRKDEVELKSFFWRGKMIARALDADEAERTAREANEKLAELDPEEPEVDVEKLQADIKEAEEQDRKQQELLDALALELENAVTQLENEKQNKQATEESLAQALEKQDELAMNYAQLKNINDQLQAWVDQLQIDLRTAIELAQQATEPLPEPVVPEEEHVPIPHNDGIHYKGKAYSVEAFNALHPHLTNEVVADNQPERPSTEVPNASFGIEFPKNQQKGDMFLRVDYLPSRLFKWNGVKWLEIDKDQRDQFAYNQEYIKLLIGKLQSGEYSIDDLNDVEKAEVAEYLNQHPNA